MNDFVGPRSVLFLSGGYICSVYWKLSKSVVASTGGCKQVNGGEKLLIQEDVWVRCVSYEANVFLVWYENFLCNFFEVSK